MGSLQRCRRIRFVRRILAELGAKTGELPRRLSPEAAKKTDAPKVHLDEKGYRWQHNEDPMAVDKLSEGIRKFNADARKLEAHADTLLQ